MYYVNKVSEVLLDVDASPYDKFISIIEVGHRAQILNQFKENKAAEALPDRKDDGLSGLLVGLQFFKIRQVPREFWEDLCPDYLSAIREYIESDVTTDEEKLLPSFALAIKKNGERAKKLVLDGHYTWADYNSWMETGCW